MTEVVAPGFHAEHIGSMISSAGGPIITMVPNPDFSFPIRPTQSSSDRQHNTSSSSRRPASASMHIDIPRSDPATTHRRASSTLPSFSFNAADTSGRNDDETPPRTPDDNIATTPGRRGHRRGGSEFVGGDSRFGVANAVSASPTKVVAPAEAGILPTGPPAGRRGHSHRRSAAISSHDVSKLMQPTAEVQPRLSSSLPSTPLEHPADAALGEASASFDLDRDDSDPFGGPLDTPAARPPSRPRVGFSDNVEFIPRPLSTISSETESSLSTIRGHSVNNSISSMLSLGSPSPPSTRTPRSYLSTTKEDEAIQKEESPTLTKGRVDKEGQWLKRSSSDSLKRPVSESAITHPRTTFIEPDLSGRPRKRALSHALGLDRRRSEPNMGSSADAPSRLSTISLQEQGLGLSDCEDLQERRAFDPKSSARKIRDWATSKITRITKESDKPSPTYTSLGFAHMEESETALRQVNAPLSPAPVAETDLDTVFSSQETASESQRPTTPGKSRFEVNTSTANHFATSRIRDYDESDTMLDLDAALGPFETPLGSHKQRKELHSSRLNRDFIGPGGHYQRRSESDPALPPYEMARDVNRPQSAMADVFEEDEEDAADAIQQLRVSSTIGGQRLATRRTRVAQDTGDAKSAFNEGLELRASRELDSRISDHSVSRSAPSNMVLEGRASSVIDEPIAEEAGSGDDVEIVEADEEPRASSQTKSSDSSDTPTIFAAPNLAVPEGQRSLMTPESYQNSAFSSPALRTGSFEAHRLDTAASSIADNRTISSCTTGELGHDLRISVDVPSLTSSRSTMISSVPGNNSRPNFSHADRTMSVTSTATDSVADSERRRKRSSIQSLSQLVGSPFGAKSKSFSEPRPQTSSESGTIQAPKKEHRLKKLMFWKSKHNSSQNLQRRH